MSLYGVNAFSDPSGFSMYLRKTSPLRHIRPGLNYPSVYTACLIRSDLLTNTDHRFRFLRLFARPPCCAAPLVLALASESVLLLMTSKSSPAESVSGVACAPSESSSRSESTSTWEEPLGRRRPTVELKSHRGARTTAVSVMPGFASSLGYTHVSGCAGGMRGTYVE